MNTRWIIGLCFSSICIMNCSDDDKSTVNQVNFEKGGAHSGGKTSSSYLGGRNSSGGTMDISQGGSNLEAGASFNGGSSPQGGDVSYAGSNALGEAVMSGGAISSFGGTVASGGISSFGGKTSSAGTSSNEGGIAGGSGTIIGGSISFGGSSISTGGVSLTGGSSQAGGMSVSGSSSTGGFVSSGGFAGTSSNGGMTATAGSSSTGGTTSTVPGIVSFVTLPDTVKTNLNTFLVSGTRPLDASVFVNGVLLPTTAFGPGRGFATAFVLVEGENVVTLEIVSATETYQSKKSVIYDPTYSTGDQRIVYVDVVTATDLYPAISGTVVLCPDENSILGLITDRHIVGTSPNGMELYFSNRSVLSRAYHGYVRTLAFTQDIPSNGFIVSPDGTILFSRSERLNVATNLLGVALPLDITTGNSWSGAPIPGGPVIASDGKRIYCCSPLNVVDVELNTTSTMGSITTTYLSDLALSVDNQTLFVSRYANTSGSLSAYSTLTNSQVGYINTSGDFAGEIGVLPDGNLIQGASGNPLHLGGGLSLFGWPAVTIINLNKVSFPLADNLSVSQVTGEIFVSSSDSTASVSNGISVYVNASQRLKLLKQFNLGVNEYQSASGVPWNNQIRKIVIAE